MKAAKIALTVVAGAAVLLVGLRLSARLPPLEPRVASSRFVDTAETALGRALDRPVREHEGLSGVHLLAAPRDAFAARVLLARAAQRSLDLQYYIWQGDLSGTLLLQAVHEAAERGVRVRLLLDDNGTSGLDTALSALDAHPNVEVRLFNPFVIRWPKAIGYLVDFFRLNRRMHNKSFTADNQATIVGGRNVGDVYFGAGHDVVYTDLDVLAVGPVVDSVSTDFDRYWASASAYPASRILPAVDEEERRRLSDAASAIERDPSARAFVEAIRTLPLVRQLIEGSLPFHWVPVEMISDDPIKGIGGDTPASRLSGQFESAVGTPDRRLELVSAYFVPGERGLASFERLAARGVRVSILTNSFAATDVALVHAGYAPYRRSLLKAGVRLFELKSGGEGEPPAEERRARLGVGGGSNGSGSSVPTASGASASALHAKTFSVDRTRLFVGSFNFDPRSFALNTELGFVIESPDLAGRIADVFEDIPPNAWQVVLDDAGDLAWVERRGSETIVHQEEPGMGPFRRGVLWIASKLPIEWML